MGREYTAEIGHKVGWHLAHYGWEPREDAEDEVVEGDKAGKAHFGSRRKAPDRFERKWLQLRQSVMRRGRVVDDRVTPGLIASIDHPVCPVTLVELTHSTGLDTEWSVDRVNNHGAYADGQPCHHERPREVGQDRKVFWGGCAHRRGTMRPGRTDGEGVGASKMHRARCLQFRRYLGQRVSTSHSRAESESPARVLPVAAHCPAAGRGQVH